MSMNATTASIDRQGRIVIPESMLSFAGITGEIAVIGAGDHFEIWSTAAWDEYAKKL
jgi:MraZ protein